MSVSFSKVHEHDTHDLLQTSSRRSHEDATIMLRGKLLPWNLSLTVDRWLAIQNVTGSNLGRSTSRQQQPWTRCSHACASVTNQSNWATTLFGWEGNLRPGESNGSLPPGGWLKVARGLTACSPGSAPDQKLGNEYGKRDFSHSGPSDFYL